MALLVTENDVSDALEILANEEGAAARAAHEYMTDLTKTVLAELMNASDEKTEAAKERAARADPKFREHLAKVGDFAKRAYSWRQRYSAAEAKIEAWRTMNANQRAAERIR